MHCPKGDSHGHRFVRSLREYVQEKQALEDHSNFGATRRKRTKKEQLERRKERKCTVSEPKSQGKGDQQGKLSQKAKD